MKKKEKFCAVCGKKWSTYTVKYNNSATNRFMIKYGVCMECALWMNRKVHPSASEIMIDGKMYMVFKKKHQLRMGNILDPKNKKTYVMLLDRLTSEIFEEIVEEGVPPEHFKTPNEAIFIDRKLAFALRNGPFECRGATCLDRYTCLFYFKDKIEKRGPANSIPEGWTDGGEGCRDYINKNNTNKFLIEWRKKKQEQ